MSLISLFQLLSGDIDCYSGSFLFVQEVKLDEEL